MDSATQFVLGAAVSTLCLGKKLGPRKAALLGGVLGTLPDLDVFLPFEDPVDAFVLHRGWTHSILVHLLVAPVLGEALVRSGVALKTHRAAVWIAVFLCLSTHAILDAMTVYGTRLLWPLSPDPIGVGSIFIIDPLFSLPLLGVVIWAFTRKHSTAALRHGVMAALLFCTAYLAGGVILQANAERRAQVIFARAGLAPSSIFAIAAPFNTVVWRVIGLEDDRYHNLYLSLFDDDAQARIYSHPRHPDLTDCLADNPALAKLTWFSRGYYRADLESDEIVISDLRMGLTPGYVFRFAIADATGTAATSHASRAMPSRMDTLDQDLSWLRDRIQGLPSVRSAEAIDAAQSAPAPRAAC